MKKIILIWLLNCSVFAFGQTLDHNFPNPIGANEKVEKELTKLVVKPEREGVTLNINSSKDGYIILTPTNNKIGCAFGVSGDWITIRKGGEQIDEGFFIDRGKTAIINYTINSDNIAGEKEGYININWKENDFSSGTVIFKISLKTVEDDKGECIRTIDNTTITETIEAGLQINVKNSVIKNTSVLKIDTSLCDSSKSSRTPELKPEIEEEKESMVQFVNKSVIEIAPNPVTNGQFSIYLDLEDASDAIVNVYDLTGNKVISLPSKYYAKGKHIIPVNVNRLRSNQYVVRVKTKHGVMAKHILVQ